MKHILYDMGFYFLWFMKEIFKLILKSLINVSWREHKGGGVIIVKNILLVYFMFQSIYVIFKQEKIVEKNGNCLAEGLAWANSGARTPLSASGNYSLYLTTFLILLYPGSKMLVRVCCVRQRRNLGRALFCIFFFFFCFLLPLFKTKEGGVIGF